MGRISQYLLSIIGVALILSVANTMVNAKGVVSAALKLLSGLILTSAIVSPWVSFHYDDLLNEFKIMQDSSSQIVASGSEMASAEIAAYIKEHTEAYILEKASLLGMNVEAEVLLNDESPPTVYSVRIVGNTSPYAKQRLSQIICDDLRIAKEHQIWK